MRPRISSPSSLPAKRDQNEAQSGFQDPAGSMWLAVKERTRPQSESAKRQIGAMVVHQHVQRYQQRGDETDQPPKGGQPEPRETPPAHPQQKRPLPMADAASATGASTMEPLCENCGATDRSKGVTEL